MRAELGRGFIARSLRPRAAKTLLPWVNYSRTDALAETFDKVFFNGKTIGDLPAHPQLCINTAILNNGQVGKFSRDGFSAYGLRHPGSQPRHMVPIRSFPLSLAVAASAAFPIGLPPVRLRRRDLPPETQFDGPLDEVHTIALTDGGVLENLGVQTLLKSSRFGTQDLIVSDAGTYEPLWNPDSWLAPVRSLAVWLFSGRILDRIMLVMNSKQNRWTREALMEEIQMSWVAASVVDRADLPAVRALVEARRTTGRRRLLFGRIAQTWTTFMRSIPRYRLIELADRAGIAVPDPDTEGVEAALDRIGIDLGRARDYHRQLGGDAGCMAVNRVRTGFTALDAATVDNLAAHAAWQIHATHAIYW